MQSFIGATEESYRNRAEKGENADNQHFPFSVNV